MSIIIRGALGAAVLACAAPASAATITYSGFCEQFCSFAKIAGAVTSVRIEQQHSGYRAFEPQMPFMGTSTYRVTGLIDVLGGTPILVDEIQETTSELYTSAVIDQFLTGDLSYFVGTGEFLAGSVDDVSYSLLSGPALGRQIGGRLFNGDIKITIDYIAAVPEPATWALMLAGFGAMAYALRRRQRLSYAL